MPSALENAFRRESVRGLQIVALVRGGRIEEYELLTAAALLRSCAFLFVGEEILQPGELERRVEQRETERAEKPPRCRALLHQQAIDPL